MSRVGGNVSLFRAIAHIRWIPACAGMTIKEIAAWTVCHQTYGQPAFEGRRFCALLLTSCGRHVLYSFMKNERPTLDSRSANLKNWPVEDDHLEMFERHIGQLTRLNEIGISIIENLDKEAAALVTAGKPLPALASKALHKLASEIQANRKMMAEIAENRRQRLADLGIFQH